MMASQPSTPCLSNTQGDYDAIPTTVTMSLTGLQRRALSNQATMILPVFMPIPTRTSFRRSSMKRSQLAAILDEALTILDDDSFNSGIPMPGQGRDVCGKNGFTSSGPSH
mmetsp:Transcript_3922/g.7811  ORF Transcript_3922/g.7811 Transcript_3922/m.7811 type:complete len:110 (+) Transcript_3922:172-501(+)|eukprot:scaffold42806_cov237-Amphora_coffeaeformis.AAC.4